MKADVRKRRERFVAEERLVLRLEQLRGELLKVPRWAMPLKRQREDLASLLKKRDALIEEAEAFLAEAEFGTGRLEECVKRLRVAAAGAQEAVNVNSERSVK